MSEPPLSDETNAAADAIEEAVRKSTVGVVTGSGIYRESGVGTGTLIDWKGSLFILTADHVVGDTPPRDLRFFGPNPAPPIRVTRAEARQVRSFPVSGIRSSVDLRLDRVIRDGSLDLAALPVEGFARSALAAEPFKYQVDGVEPSEGLTSLVFGFPIDISRIMSDDTRMLLTEFDWSPVQAPRNDLSGFDPAVHFLTAYSPPVDHDGANPHGLSGAARWARRGATPGLWHPNIDVIGVTVTYYPHHRLLKMVKRKSVTQFLSANIN